MFWMSGITGYLGILDIWLSGALIQQKRQPNKFALLDSPSVFVSPPL